MSKKQEQSLLGHLDELRKRCTVVAIANLTAAVLLFNQASKIMEYLLAINPGMQLIYINPSELLVVYIELSFIMALIICSPINIYELWAFVEKGLYKKEKVYIIITLFFGVICFVGGALFCYFTVLPTTLQFFVRIAVSDISAMISVKEYMSFVNSMLLAFGVVFEMPVIVFLLTKLEILRPAFFKANRNILIVLIFIVAAIITPPDVMSQIMLAIPMCVLLEISMFICIIVDKGINRKHPKLAEAEL